MSQNKKLYVGSLPYSITEEQLKDVFAPFGAVVSVRIVTDKFTGKSKGFGFVEIKRLIVLNKFFIFNMDILNNYYIKINF